MSATIPLELRGRSAAVRKEIDKFVRRGQIPLALAILNAADATSIGTTEPHKAWVVRLVIAYYEHPEWQRWPAYKPKPIPRTPDGILEVMANMANNRAAAHATVLRERFPLR